MVDNLTIKDELVFAYKILAYLKWDDHTYTHLSSRSAEGDSYYIYPFGLRFEEVEASSLLKVSLDGEVLEGKEYQYNRTGYIIHGAIYSARPDIKSILHVHTPEIIAVSAYEHGLIPASQWALHFYNKISYHQYNSLTLDPSIGKELILDLAQNFVMLLRNHGSLTCGRTIQEAMFYTYHLQQACKAQCLMAPFIDQVIIPSKEICEKTVHDLLSFEPNLGERDWHAWTRLIKRNEI